MRDNASSAYPCGWLVNDKPCPRGMTCGHDHDSSRVENWKNDMGKKHCRKGESCEHLLRGNCLYYHPAWHVQRDRLYDERTTKRHDLIRKDLKLLEWFKLQGLDMGEDAPVEIEDVRAISSFNKIGNNQIAVPGVPPRLHPLTQRLDLKLDPLNKSLTRNYPMYTHYFEPLIRSSEVTDPEYALIKADIVTNASNLRKMFMLFQNQQLEHERYDLTWRHNTLFLSKWTSDPRLNTSLGHGSGFEQATCIYEDHEDEVLKSSTSHHRVTQYRFGGLQLVVQSEVDAYHCDCHCPGAGSVDPTLPETMSALTIDEVAQHRRRDSAVSAGTSGQTSILTVDSPVFSITSVDCLRDSTRETSPLTSPTSPCCPPTTKEPDPPFSGALAAPAVHLISSTTSSPTLHVFHLGRDIPASCLVEVKTHKVDSTPLFNAEAQLYFSQVNKLYIAKNDKGVFLPSNVSRGNGSSSRNPVQDKTEDIKQWAKAEENQKHLRKVVALLKKLIELTKWYQKKKGLCRLTLVMINTGEGKESAVKTTLYARPGDGSGECLPDNWLDADGAEVEVGGEVGGEGAGDQNLKDGDLEGKGKGRSVEDT